MQFLNVGVLELVFLLLLALIVLGPKRAVKFASDVGRWVREATKSRFWQDILATSREIQDLPKKVMDDAELQKVMEELDRSSNEIMAVLDDAGPNFIDDLGTIGHDLGEPHQVDPLPPGTEIDHINNEE